MTGKQHVGRGVAGTIGFMAVLSSVVGVVLNPIMSVSMLVGSVLGSYMPDIDSKKSKASQVFNKVLLYIIVAFGVSNILSTALNLTFLEEILKHASGGMLGNFGLVLFALLALAGKLSPHRGFTHKWFGTGLFCASTFIAFNQAFAIGFTIGYALHILADRTTSAGKHLNFLEFRLPCQNSKGDFKLVF